MADKKEGTPPKYYAVVRLFSVSRNAYIEPGETVNVSKWTPAELETLLAQGALSTQKPKPPEPPEA